MFLNFVFQILCFIDFIQSNFEDGIYSQLEFLKTGCNVLFYDILICYLETDS